MHLKVRITNVEPELYQIIGMQTHDYVTPADLRTRPDQGLGLE